LLLRRGEIVAFPTETVYGLGARADDPAAVRRLRALKRRPPEKRFTILIPAPPETRRYAAPLCPAAEALARAFWPGPLTLVVTALRGGEVGLRCPDFEPTREMLRAAGVPVAAPSANLSGRPPATTAPDVLEVFDGLVAAVLDGGPVRLAVASTVVRVSGSEVVVLREGAIPEARIREALAGAAPAPHAEGRHPG